MTRRKLFATVTLLLIIVGSIFVTYYVGFNQEGQKPFYVGVTHYGSSVEETKEFIDKVKDYTNLFVVQGVFFGETLET